MVIESKEVYVTGSDGVRYRLVADKSKKNSRSNKKRKQFKAYGGLYKEDGEKILQLLQNCVRLSGAKWNASDVVSGLLLEYFKQNADLEKISKDLINGCYNS